MNRINRTTKLLIGLLLAVGLISLTAYLFWPAPQFGGDESVKNEVDALFTAITARDEKLLRECATRISVIKSQSRLPSAAANRIERLIGEAQQGEWESAAKKLYALIKSQRE